jgi:hypothetical protein
METIEILNNQPEAGESPSSQPQPLQPDRSQRGARAHYLGNLVAAYVGRQFGARRVRQFANHHDLDGQAFQIRTISGSQNTFTVNRDTEPDRIIAVRRTRNGYSLFGIRREDALAVAKKSSSRGHVKSGHQQVSLPQVKKVELGSIAFPDALVHADTSDQRRRLLEQIDGLAPDLGSPAVIAARAFLTEQLV